jgi:hypothetical protein
MPAAHSGKKPADRETFVLQTRKNGNGRRTFGAAATMFFPQQTIRTQPADSR